MSSGAPPTKADFVLVKFMVASVIGVIILAGFVYSLGVNWTGSEQLYFVFELFAFILAAVLCILALMRFYVSNNNSQFLLVLGFFGAAVIDGYSGAINFWMFNAVGADIEFRQIYWGDYLSRLYLSIFIFTCWVIWLKERNAAGVVNIRFRNYFLAAGGLLIAGLGTLQFVDLPNPYFNSFLIHRPLDLIPPLLMAVPVYQLIKHKIWQSGVFGYFQVLAFFILLIGQLLFMPFSLHLFDLDFYATHAVRIFGYLVFLAGYMYGMHYNYLSRRESFVQLSATKDDLEIEARAKEVIFAKAFDASPAMQTISRMSDAKHVDVNETWLKTLGYSRQEAMETTAVELGIWVDLDRREEMVRLFGKFGFVRDFETRFRTKSGEIREVSINGEFLEYGDEKRVLIVAHDITNQKQAEAAIQRHVESLEKANQELEEFSYVASHDLQEPLRTIASYSKLLKDDIGDELNEDAAEDIHFIIDAADRMRSMVQDLLELSRAGRSALKSQIVDLNDCMDQVKHDLKVRLEETGGSIESQDLPTVEGDPSQLTRVLLNLVGNGLKFHGDEAPHVDISACKMEDDWRISVSDNGIGIPEQYQDQIFAPFKRLHGTAQYSGTGIGLAVVRKVVERHGGHVSIESTPGIGTSIAFTLPEVSELEKNSDVEI